MAQTVVALFDTFEQAQVAVQALRARGVGEKDISVVANDADGRYTQTTGETPGDAAGTGALSGGILGGALGLLVGIGALAIPGIGPVLAVGPLAAALGSAGAGALIGAGVGAVSGGLIGALVDIGIPEEEANLYAEGVRRGGVLVSATSDNVDVDSVVDVLNSNGAIDVNTRGETWRAEGWERFDPNVPAVAAKRAENQWEESSKVGTATGTVAGAATGAAMGSVAGPVGTVVGGLVGAAAGAATGAAADVTGEAVEDAAQNDPNYHDKKPVAEAARPGDAAYTSDPAYRSDTENPRAVVELEDAAYTTDPATHANTADPQRMTAEQAMTDRIDDTARSAAYVAERGAHEERIETHGGDVADVDRELTEEERRRIDEINR